MMPVKTAGSQKKTSTNAQHSMHGSSSSSSSVQCRAPNRRRLQEVSGALLATMIVFGLAHGEGSWSALRLLLTGVVVAAGSSALVSMLLALGDDHRLRGMLFWLMGDLSLRSRPSVLLGLLAFATIAGIPLAPSIA